MIQFRHRLDLGPKARSNIWRIEQVRENHLQRNDAARFGLHSPIDDAHAAVRNLLLHDKSGNEFDAFFIFLSECRDQTPGTRPSPVSFRQRCAAFLAY